MSEDARIIGLLITMFGGTVLVLFAIVWVKDGLRESCFTIGSVFLFVAGIAAAVAGLGWAWGFI